MSLRTILIALLFCVSALRAQDPHPAPAGETAVTEESLVRAEPAAQALVGADRHLIDLLDRYVWVIPHAVSHRLSLGAAFLLALALVLQLSAKMADIELRTFGRCVTMAAVLFALVTAQLGLLRSHVAVVVGFVLGNAFAWLGLARLVLGARAWQAFAMLVCFSFASLIAVVLLEVAGFLLGGHVMG